LPRNSAVRKINELVKRARLAKVNAHVVTYLKNQMPMMMGAKKKQDQLIADMGIDIVVYDNMDVYLSISL
jgi:EH domain-containing protein 1